MTLHLPKLVSLTAAIVATVVFGIAAVTAQNSGPLDIDRYCKQIYGPESRSILLSFDDPESWRCAAGAEQVRIPLDLVCNAQYGVGTRAVLGPEKNSYSWSCQAPAEKKE
jgi:hypothetical protein